MLTSHGRFPIQFHLSAGQLSALLCGVPRAPQHTRTRTPSCNLALVGGESAGRWMEDWQVAWSCDISRPCCITEEAVSVSQAFTLKGGSGVCWDWSEIPWCLQCACFYKAISVNSNLSALAWFLPLHRLIPDSTEILRQNDDNEIHVFSFLFMLLLLL